MSSESLDKNDLAYFQWHTDLNIEHYVQATYYIETALEPEFVAIAMAREQSALVARLHTINYDIESCAARVMSVEQNGKTATQFLPPYWLNTTNYLHTTVSKETYWQATIRIAFPLNNFPLSVTGLWNVVIGELPRLGFLNAVRLTNLEYPENFIQQFPGPRYGIEGIRELLNMPNKPLFCRSTRPAVGLSVEAMYDIGGKVLRNGFDILKDDELTYAANISEFHHRIAKMTTLCHSVTQETNQKKLFFANVIDDFSATLELAEVAQSLGAQGIIVAPAIQGMMIIPEMVKRFKMIVLAHNSNLDLWTRLPKFGISPAVVFKLQRLCGADLIMLPGEFATPSADSAEMERCIQVCQAPMGNIKPCLPIMAGGKRANELSQYIDSVGNTDFMLIVATAMDEHPQGIETGAREFQQAWQVIQKDFN